MEKLVLIDGNSLLNRAFYATPILTTKKGEYTNAVYGFINMLTKFIEDEKPKYLVVAFDVKAPTFRHKKYKEYKGTRKAMPLELVPQFSLLKEILTLMRITIIEQAGIEADDIIGALSKKFRCDNIIITGDKDSFQLVDECTKVFFTKRGLSDLDVLDNENFKAKTLINPIQIIDLKSLMGDSSDNIPGVKGVGEKTALSLLNSYNSLENIYEHIKDIKGALQQKLIENKDMAFLSKELATIDINIKFDINLEDLVFDFPFDENVKQKFLDLEFKTLSKKNIFNEDVDDNIAKARNINIIVSEINSIEQLKKLKLNNFCLYFEKDISIYLGEDKEYFIKIKDNFFDEGIEFDSLLNYLKEIFENFNNTITTFNRKFLEHKLYKFDIKLNAKIIDISIKKYIVDFSGKEENLSDIIFEYSQDEKFKAYSIYKINQILDNKLKEDNLEKLYYDVELPLSKVLFDMEIAGFKMDIKMINEFHNKYTLELKNLSKEIYDLAGEIFNINSPKQLSVILFEKLGLKPPKKTKTSYSTNAEVLENLIDDNEIIEKLLKFRQKQKLLSTYIDGFVPLIDKNTGLVHTTFNQLLTATGRLSSKEPNLQNIPVRDDEGKEIRKFFISRDDDHILVGADYSQIELRLLAHFSNCKKLIDAYNNNEDIHAITASQVFNVPLKDVTPSMRRNAKAVNFGIIYGISEYGLSKNLKISNKKASEYINKYFDTYKEVKEYMNKNVEEAKKLGFVTTILGRKRVIKEINASNFNVRSFGERAAMNMPLQGSSADIIKVAMINVYNRLIKNNLKSKLILQVHDELIIDALISEKNIVEKILKEEMENSIQLKVPLTVEVYSTKCWFDAK